MDSRTRGGAEVYSEIQVKMITEVNKNGQNLAGSDTQAQIDAYYAKVQAFVDQP